jgi:hypothetical protein
MKYIKLIIFLLLFVCAINIKAQTLSYDNVTARKSFVLNGRKITNIQNDSVLGDPTKIPTSLAVERYVQGQKLDLKLRYMMKRDTVDGRDGFGVDSTKLALMFNSTGLHSVTTKQYYTHNPIEVRAFTDYLNPRIKFSSGIPGNPLTDDEVASSAGYRSAVILMTAAGEGADGASHDSTFVTAHDIRNIDNDGTLLMKYPLANKTSQFIPLSVNGVYANSSGNITIAVGGGSAADTIQIHTSGSTVNVGDSTSWLIINPSSALTSLTVNLPSTSTVGKTIRISFGGTINAPATVVVNTLTIAPYAGSGVVGSTVFYSVETSDNLTFKYYSSLSKWYRQ